MIQDLTHGEDIRGDYALFIDGKHIDGWELDDEAKRYTQETTFFRVIKNGKQTSSHGWAENGEIVQWG